MSAATTAEPDRLAALAASAAALERLAGYELPAELDDRILALGERKDELTPAEAAELRAWVAFTQERSLDKFGAAVALRRLAAAFPELADRP